MNILMVNKYLYKKGGNENSMFMLANLLQKNGHNVFFFGLRNTKNIVDNEFLLENSESLNKITAPFKSIYSIEAKKKIKACIETYNIDIVHMFDFMDSLTPSIIYQASKMGKKVILNIIDSQIVCPNKKMYIPHKSEECKRCRNKRFYNCFFNKCIESSYLKSFGGALKSSIYHYLNTYKKHVDLIISPSQFIKDRLEEMGFKHNNLKVINNFLDITPKDVNYKKANYILYFGRISNENGLKTLLYAMKALRNDKVLLKIAGEGPMKKELEKYVQENKLDNVQFITYKNHDQLEKHIRKAIVTIYPSEFEENCPIPVIESLAYGIPVIASNAGSMPEIIDNEENGVLFEKGNYMDLACKIKELINEKEKLEQMSFKAKEKYLEKFTSGVYYESMMKEYGDSSRV